MTSLSDVDAWPSVRRVAAYRNFLNYLFPFKLISYSEMTKVYPAGLVQNLSRDGTLLFEAKSYVYNRVCELPTHPGCFQLTTNQKLWLRKAASSSPALVQELHKARKCYPALLPDDLRMLTEDTLSSKEFDSFLGKFSYRKMSFLVSSYGVSHADLVSEMKLAACYAILRAYPVYSSRLHVLNIGKTAAHNRGINLIHEYTSASRNRLVSSSSGEHATYGATTFSLEALQESSANQGVLVLDHHSLVVDSKENERVIDTSLAFLQLEERLPPKKKALIQLLRGVHDEDFSTYLGEDNEDFAEKATYDHLLKKACVFLSINEKAARGWLSSLRDYL